MWNSSHRRNMFSSGYLQLCLCVCVWSQERGVSHCVVSRGQIGWQRQKDPLGLWQSFNIAVVVVVVALIIIITLKLLIKFMDKVHLWNVVEWQFQVLGNHINPWQFVSSASPLTNWLNHATPSHPLVFSLVSSLRTKRTRSSDQTHTNTHKHTLTYTLDQIFDLNH